MSIADTNTKATPCIAQVSFHQHQHFSDMFRLHGMLFRLFVVVEGGSSMALAVSRGPKFFLSDLIER